MTRRRGMTQGGAPGEPVIVQTRFDRFPATLKGALVLRGGDPDPHRVRLESASIVRLPNGPARPIPMGDIFVDIAPARDLFLPFEAPISELEPGWYAIRSEIVVDGGPQFMNTGRAFSVPWPRNEVRTGAVSVNATVRAGDRSFRIERVELKTDRATVVWHEAARGGSPADDPPGDAQAGPGVCVRAGGSELHEVASESGAAGGPDVGRRSIFYPVARGVDVLAVSVRLASGEESPPLEIALD